MTFPACYGPVGYRDLTNTSACYPFWVDELECPPHPPNPMYGDGRLSDSFDYPMLSYEKHARRIPSFNIAINLNKDYPVCYGPMNYRSLGSSSVNFPFRVDEFELPYLSGPPVPCHPDLTPRSSTGISSRNTEVGTSSTSTSLRPPRSKKLRKRKREEEGENVEQSSKRLCW